MFKKSVAGFIVVLVLAFGVSAYAQSAVLDLPRPSQHAVVTQRVGITDAGGHEGLGDEMRGFVRIEE